MAHRQKHTRGNLTKGTRAKGLNGSHFGGMRGSVRHKAHWSTRPTAGKHHSREHTRARGKKRY